MRRLVLWSLVFISVGLTALLTRAQEKGTLPPKKSSTQEKSPPEETTSPEKSPSPELSPKNAIEKELGQYDVQELVQMMANAEYGLSYDGRQIIKKRSRLQNIQARALKAKEMYESNQGGFRDHVDRAQAFFEERRSDLENLLKMPDKKQRLKEFSMLLASNNIDVQTLQDLVKWRSVSKALDTCEVGIKGWNRQLEKPVLSQGDDADGTQGFGFGLDEQAAQNSPDSGGAPGPNTERSSPDITNKLEVLLQKLVGDSAGKAPSRPRGTKLSAPVGESTGPST